MPESQITKLYQKVGALEQRSHGIEKSLNEVSSQQKEILIENKEWITRLELLSDEEHQIQHEFLKVWIQERKQIQELRQQIISKILTGGVLACFAGLSALLWLGIKTKFGIGE